MKYTLIAVGLNVLSILFFSIPMLNCTNGDCIGAALTTVFLAGWSLVVQLIIALFLLNNDKRKTIGQAMLLTVGVSILIGFSLCSIR